jgi:hypothetical protein
MFHLTQIPQPLHKEFVVVVSGLNLSNLLAFHEQLPPHLILKVRRVGNHRRILIDNNDIDSHLYVDHGEPWLYSSVNEGETISYAFDEMDLRGHANLIFDYPPSGSDVEVIVHEMQGDLTGLILFHL